MFSRGSSSSNPPTQDDSRAVPATSRRIQTRSSLRASQRDPAIHNEAEPTREDPEVETAGRTRRRRRKQKKEEKTVRQQMLEDGSTNLFSFYRRRERSFLLAQHRGPKGAFSRAFEWSSISSALRDEGCGAISYAFHICSLRIVCDERTRTREGIFPAFPWPSVARMMILMEYSCLGFRETLGIITSSLLKPLVREVVETEVST